MPAASDGSPPRIPRTYRPVGARIAAASASAALVAAITLVWVRMPASVRADFTIPQRVTLLGFLLVGLALLYAIFRTAARADAEGLTIVNGYRLHRVTWPEVVRVSLSPSRPWALLDLADGTTLSVMALQTADGARGVRAARELAVMAAAFGDASGEGSGDGTRDGSGRPPDSAVDG